MPSPSQEAVARGFIVPIGGAEDKVADQVVLRKFLELSGDKDAHIVIIPTASQLEDTGDRYVKIFEELGAGSTDVLRITERDDAKCPERVERLQKATGVFMTGGNQLRLSTILGGTELATNLRRLNAAGVHIGGTSAGAAFISEHMIAYGAEGSTPEGGMVTLAPGLGLSNAVIVDQHFRQRDRLGRLLSALAFNPFMIGIGLDEDTAAFIGPDNLIRVLGNGAITVVDVSELAHSSMADVRDGEPVELIDIRLHVLGHGSRYCLDNRKAEAGSQR